MTESSVTIDGECVGKIGKGFLVLFGVTHSDTKAEADFLVDTLLDCGLTADRLPMGVWFDQEDGATRP